MSCCYAVEMYRKENLLNTLVLYSACMKKFAHNKICIKCTERQHYNPNTCTLIFTQGPGSGTWQ